MQPVQTALSNEIEGSRQKPISRITVYPTSKTFPSLGFRAEFFTLDNDDAIVSGGNNWMGTAANSWTPVTGVNYKYPTNPATASHSATFDVDNGSSQGTITAGSGTPYSIFNIDDVIIVSGTGDNDGEYIIYSVTDTVITTTTVIAGTDGVEASTVIRKRSSIIEPSTVMSFDWGVAGSPAPVGQSHLFAIRFHGFFYARYAGVHRFFLDAPRHARIRIKFSGSYLTLKDPDDDSTVSNWTSVGLANGTRKELYADSASLTANTWHEIWIEYWISEQKTPPEEPNFLCVKYREPDTTTAYDEFGNTGGTVVSDYQSDYPLAKVLSAGVVSCSQSDGTLTSVTTGNVGFLTGDELTQVHSINGSRGIDEAAEYTFEVPIPNATTLSANVSVGSTAISVQSTDGFPSSGYGKIGTDEFTYADKDATNLKEIPNTGDMALLAHSSGDVVHLAGAGDYPFDPTDKSFGVLKAFYLCRIEMGYEDFSDVSYYADRIWGFIFPNPAVSRSLDGADVLKVSERDFRMLLLQDGGEYFKNYPDYASYAGARYYKDSLLSEPNGVTRPVAYDRWALESAVRDMLMKANIDPVLLYARQRKAVTGGANYATDYGDYLVKCPVQLDSKKNYGNAMLVGETGADDVYNWFFGWGRLLMEGVSELYQNFLYQFGFQPDGKAYFRAINLPSKYFNDSGIEDDGFSYSTEPIAITAPNGGESWAQGTSQNITWTTDAAGNVKIELYVSFFMRFFGWTGYYKDMIYGTIVASTADDGTYSWAIPSDLRTEYDGMPLRYKIRIVELDDTDNFDFSDAYFLVTT